MALGGDIDNPSAAGGNVDSVNTQTGDVVLDADDIDDSSTAHKFATSTQLSNADSAVQPGDNVSDLTNDSGYITDYTVTEADVTTHQAALSITESQISDLDHYTDTDANTAIDTRVNKAFVDALNVDADTLDGNDSAAFATSSHTHTESEVTDLGTYLENVVEDTTPQLGGDLDAQTNDITNVTSLATDEVDFDTATANPAHSEGLAFYDNTKKALSYYNEEADVTVNVGQENVIRVRNTTGSTITNGQAVYVSGAQGANLPLVSLAQADALATARCIGLATHDIEHNSNGYVTSLGTVGGLDTSSFTAGLPVFLSTTVAGGLTQTRPTTGFAVVVGDVTISNVATGEIKVIPGTTVQRANLQVEPSEGGFEDGDKTKLDGIEAGADVTDTANVTAAGALMDSEVDADIKTLSLPASTTISTFGASLVDDATASAARTTLGVAIGSDVQAWDADLDTYATKTPPSGAVVGTTDTQTLTNKTMSGSSNTFSNIPFSALPDGVQIGYQVTELNTSSTTSAVIPRDDTIPQNTEGTEIITVAITPKSSTSKLVVKARVYGSAGNSSEGATLALFRDSTSNAIGASALTSVNSADFNLEASAVITAGSTSATTFKVRIGSNDGNAIRWNGSGGRYFGDIPKSYIEVTEVKA